MVALDMILSYRAKFQLIFPGLHVFCRISTGLLGCHVSAQ